MRKPPSPSPRPSPLGSLHGVPPRIGTMKRQQLLHSIGLRFSLSPGERAGVRGKRTFVVQHASESDVSWKEGEAQSVFADRAGGRSRPFPKSEICLEASCLSAKHWTMK